MPALLKKKNVDATDGPIFTYLRYGSHHRIRHYDNDYKSYAYFALVFYYTLFAMIKGIGYPTFPMFVSLLDTCVIRSLWIFIIFPRIKTLEALYVIYPISWVTSAIMCGIFVLCVWKKKKREVQERNSFLSEKAV